LVLLMVASILVEFFMQGSWLDLMAGLFGIITGLWFVQKINK